MMQVSKYIPYHWTCSKDTKFMVSRETEKKNWKIWEKSVLPKLCVHGPFVRGSGARAGSIYTYQYSAFYLKKLNIRKWSFLLLQQGGYNELHVMAMMSRKRSAKLVKFMAPWVRNSGLWVWTIWLQNDIACKVRIFTVNGNYLFLLRIIFFLNCGIHCAKCGFRHFGGWGTDKAI